MSGVTMTIPTMSKIGHMQNPLGREARYKRRLARALKAWPSGEALSFDLAERGIERDARTCNRYRSGTSCPPPWLHDLLLEMSVEQTRQQIRALEQRLEFIGG